ncbi:thioredoxin-disulfide reductase [Wolbachia pipientis]|uniref:thioredoxin-disulfide reductase n=1 Tax=Wolbachia pipientis TaxID=955 RepID=UPI002573DC82|nr:thioredoxin-disulfide reductase [Wolbachia pipientis]BDG75572.1 thioredoxin reductase [Wolbachia pipientis]
MKEWLIISTHTVQNYKLSTKVLIIGSGAAGYAAAIYAARANLEPIVVTGMQPGGQLTITTDVENYPGFISIQGPELMEQKRLHAEKAGARIIDDEIKSVEQLEDSNEYRFRSCGNASDYYSNAIIIAAGAQAKWLGLESEKKFQGYGVSACATCDGAFFRNKVVAVVGGGNTAVEEAIFLTRFAKEVILIHRRDKLRAEKVMQDRLFKNDKIKVIWNHTVEQILGEENPKKVTGITIKSTDINKTQELKVDGVFIAIGHAPNTGIFKGFVEMDQQGYIITKPGTTLTSRAGVFAAGDVQDKVYRQAVVAAGTGCMAALDAEKFLES